MEIEERLISIEKTCKTLKWVSVGLFGGFIGSFLIFSGAFLFLLSKDTRDIINVKEINIIDDNGRQRGKFGFNTSGNSGLQLFDKEGISRVRLGFDSNGNTALQLYDKKEKLRGGFGFGPTGNPAIELYDKEESRSRREHLY